MTTLKSIAFKRDTSTHYVAVCLDHFLAAQGNTLSEAMDNLHTVIEGTILLCKMENANFKNGFKSAPTEYHNMAKNHLGHVFNVVVNV
jgi:predicted RNase H-like HicB family nuclease